MVISEQESKRPVIREQEWVEEYLWVTGKIGDELRLLDQRLEDADAEAQGVIIEEARRLVLDDFVPLTVTLLGRVTKHAKWVVLFAQYYNDNAEDEVHCAILPVFDSGIDGPESVFVQRIDSIFEAIAPEEWIYSCGRIGQFCSAECVVRAIAPLIPSTKSRSCDASFAERYHPYRGYELTPEEMFPKETP